jgi:hypothetical protein
MRKARETERGHAAGLQVLCNSRLVPRDAGRLPERKMRARANGDESQLDGSGFMLKILWHVTAGIAVLPDYEFRTQSKFLHRFVL